MVKNKVVKYETVPPRELDDIKEDVVLTVANGNELSNKKCKSSSKKKKIKVYTEIESDNEEGEDNNEIEMQKDEEGNDLREVHYEFGVSQSEVHYEFGVSQSCEDSDGSVVEEIYFTKSDRSHDDSDQNNSDEESSIELDLDDEKDITTENVLPNDIEIIDKSVIKAELEPIEEAEHVASETEQNDTTQTSEQQSENVEPMHEIECSENVESSDSDLQVVANNESEVNVSECEESNDHEPVTITNDEMEAEPNPPNDDESVTINDQVNSSDANLADEQDIILDKSYKPGVTQTHVNGMTITINQKPWHKYMEACRKTLIPGKRYEQVSTEQDPEDATQETLPSIEGPHTMEELTEGIRYKLKYLGSSQIVSQHPITKETRMQQAQDAFNRIKGAEDDEDDVSTNVNMLLSLERIKILNQDTKFEDVMMDHALRTVCFICDMGKILVLMARRLTSDHSTDFSLEQGKPISLGNIVGDREKKTSKNICHVFETEDASKIAKAIGQAFNIAYRNFLQSNGISHEHVEEAEYCHVLESQKLVGADLDRLTDQSNAKEVVLNKKAGEQLGIMLLESGWGSMLPTVFVAHIANYSVAARCQQLTVGDHVLSCNGSSLVGIPLSECNTILKNSRSSNRVVLKLVTCPPVVDVVITRPDVKYQLGFSVQNGTICSLLRGGIAERGGVRVGHRIIEINGDSVVAKSHQYIVDLLANTIGSIGMKTMPIAMYRLMVGDDQPQHV